MATAGLGLVVYGASRTAFVPDAHGSLASDSGMALGGVVAGEQVGAGESNSDSGHGMHVVARSGNHRSHGVVRKTADVAVKEPVAAEDAAKAETETPPPTRLLPQQKRLESPHLCFFF